MEFDEFGGINPGQQSISKEDMQPLTSCGNIDGNFYHIMVEGHTVGWRYKSSVAAKNTYYSGEGTSVLFKANPASGEIMISRHITSVAI